MFQIKVVELGGEIKIGILRPYIELGYVKVKINLIFFKWSYSIYNLYIKSIPHNIPRKK